MSDYPISAEEPFSLILAADYRFGTQKMGNETVWEVQPDGGGSGGLSLYSTLALSASSIRIFPFFSNQIETRTKLSQFVKPLVVQAVFPSYARFVLEPFEDIVVKIEYWVKESNLTLGRIIISNGSSTQFIGSTSWAMQFVPLEGGSNMKIIKTRSHPYLLGKTTRDYLVFLSNGAPSAGKYGQISLENNHSIQPGTQQVYHWAFAREASESAAIINANSHLNINWEAEVARVEVIGQRDHYYFQTGNREWDIALSAGQKLAHQVILHPSHTPTELVFLKNRTPEQNFPVETPPFTYADNIQANVLDLWYLLQVNPALAPFVRAKITEVLLAFDKPDEGVNQSERVNLLHSKLPFPLVAASLVETFPMSADQDWLKENFGRLCNYLSAWLSVSAEENNDSIPTWSNALQTLFEDLPIHNRWNQDGEGIDTKYIISPMLLSLLLREIQHTLELGKSFKEAHELNWLEQKESFLREQLNTLWDGRKHRYHYADKSTNKSFKTKNIFTCQGSGKFSINRKLNTINRLSLRLFSQQEHTHNARILLEGELEGKSVIEEITPRSIHWYGQNGFYTSVNVFDRIVQVEVHHAPQSDTLSIRTCNFALTDLTLGLPLWANACDPKRAKILIEDWLIPEYMQASGFPLLPMSEQPMKNDKFNIVDLELNCLLLHGLVQYGYDKDAIQLLSNNMYAIKKNLKLFHRMMQQYDASDGYGTGEYNIIKGAPPITIFLKLAGIKKWSRREVIIDNISVYEKPITILYNGFTIKTTSSGHQFFSPGGAIIETTGKGPHLIRIPE
ncbi:MAG: hypothetical protein BGO78_04210 [Chloroflexi bacterium 44-23]|nr:MAG: hypothetical protein BGO78_04210 [Chloroflexi bacterium 44-23]